MNSIHIGKVTVPLVDYAVGASAVLGIRDSGKTVTSKGIAEQLLDNNVPIIVFDAVGKWRWMKMAGEQSGGRGYKIVVAGGRGPDLPLTPHSVPEIVRAALKQRIPLIIDLFSKELSKADWRRIVQLAIHIIHYENEGGAVHVFLEEAAEFVPQKIYDGETYAEVEKLVRMGGNASVGITLINQRSQEVNKAVLDNCSTALVLGCQVGKNAIEAVEKWIDRLDPDTADEVTKSLPKLQSGEAWVWTRKSLDKPTREKMPMCRSFHPDRRTPEIVLKSAKATDTAEFVAKLADSIPKVIEEAKANDPATLKRTVAELKQKLAKAEQKQPEVKQSEPVQVPILTDENMAALKRVEFYCNQLLEVTQGRADTISEMCQIISDLRLGLIRQTISKAQPTQPHSRPAPVARPQVSRRPVAEAFETNGDDPGKGAREVLKAAAQHPDGVTDEQIAVLTGYKKTSRTTFKQRLKERGYLTEGGRGYQATDTGIQWLGNDFEPLPTGQALQEHWLNKLSGGELECFKVYLNHYPHDVQIDQLMEQTGYLKTSVTTFRQRLAARNLIDGKRASANLFE